VIDLFKSGSCSLELINYLVNTYNLEYEFPFLEEGEFMKNNLDFMLRFWKRDDYKTIPKVNTI